MARFNTPLTRPNVTSPLTTTGVTLTTHEGARAYARDPKSELFLLAVANMVGTDTFYEQGESRDMRYAALVRQLAVEDVGWLTQLATWLRAEANMRTASLVLAVEAVHERLQQGLHGHNRELIDTVCQRADEPGELLAYWTSRYGRAIPKPVKRGLADAVRRLYTQRSLLKYDTDTRGYRFGDVLDLVHATPAEDKQWQGDLFRHALDRRHNRTNPIPDNLQLLTCRRDLMALPVEDRRPFLTGPHASRHLQQAGMTWEAVAGWLQGPMDALAWETVIDSMGYMALLRNLRNFDEAGVSDEVATRVASKLADPEQVATSRQFPFRFYAAHKAVTSLRWGHALEKALTASLGNVPALPGRTLILVDQSPSMFPGYYYSSPTIGDISNADKATLFGSALALRAADATLVGYGQGSYVVPHSRGEAVLHLMGKFRVDDGTDTVRAIRDHYQGHDRVVIITDEQTATSRYGTVDSLVPKPIPVYTWNLVGYQQGHTPSGTGNRHTFGGLTDAAFAMIPLLEAGRNATWPWL